jgi:hypothetical protein
MLFYTTPRGTVQKLLLKHYVSSASGANIPVQNILHSISICYTASLGYHVYEYSFSFRFLLPCCSGSEDSSA